MIVLSYMCFQKEKILARHGGNSKAVICAKDRLSKAEYRNWLNAPQAESRNSQYVKAAATKRFDTSVLESKVTLRGADEILAEINALQGLNEEEREMANRRFSRRYAVGV